MSGRSSERSKGRSLGRWGNIRRYIKRFLAKDDIFERQTEGFQKVREILGLGEQTPSENACDAVLKLIEEKKQTR